MDNQDRLLEQIAAPENLLQAWRGVRGNIPKYRRQRAKGPDGITLIEFERDLQVQLLTLRDMLIHQRYQPMPPGRFLLPKKDGGQREIAVLTIADRVAQRAAVQVLEPIWEPGFLNCSYGYRPGRSIEQALSRVQNVRARGHGWVIDGDIQKCFDNLDHDLLTAHLQKRVHDKRVLDLLHTWLEAGIVRAGPPVDEEAPLTERVRGVAAAAQRGLDWLLASAAMQDDPYAAARYEEVLEEMSKPSKYPERDTLVSNMRRVALRRLALNSVILGVGWARETGASLGGKALLALKNPVSRRLLKKGVLASGGFASLAAIAAIAAYALNQKAGSAPVGVLQGSPLSPLLMNIYLHPFDVSMVRRSHRIVRFADDWVILCPAEENASQAYNHAYEALARIRLKLNANKTHIRKPGEPFEWLGAVVR